MANSILKALRELSRLILLAIVGFFLTEGVVGGIISHFFGAKLDAWSVAQITVLSTTILRTIDKFLYEYGKETNNETLKMGLTFGL